MRYSEEFKNHVVSRLLTGEVTIAQRLGGALGAITTVIVLEQAATTDNQLAYGWGGALLVAFAVASMVTSTLLKPPLKQSD